jgi:hypothetical protein
MNIYLSQDEIKPGILVRVMSYRTNKIIPALILESDHFKPNAMERFISVMDTEGQTYLMNTLYLERWK